VGGTNDRGLGVGVHPVGGVDLDIGEPGSGERVSELGAGEGAGDARGSLGHVVQHGSGGVARLFDISQ